MVPSASWNGSIQLIGLRCLGTHGALPAEQTHPQPFVVDLALQLDVVAAGEHDDLQSTVDYGAAAQICAEVIAGPSRALIETLALEIARRLLAAFPPLSGGEVVVHKPQAPLGLGFGDVAAHLAFAREP